MLPRKRKVSDILALLVVGHCIAFLLSTIAVKRQLRPASKFSTTVGKLLRSLLSCDKKLMLTNLNQRGDLVVGVSASQSIDPALIPLSIPVMPKISKTEFTDLLDDQCGRNNVEKKLAVQMLCLWMRCLT